MAKYLEEETRTASATDWIHRRRPALNHNFGETLQQTSARRCAHRIGNDKPKQTAQLRVNPRE